MKKLTLSALMCSAVISVSAQTKSKVVLKTEKDTVSYALALNMAKFYQQMGFETLNLDILKQAMQESFSGTTPLFDGNIGETYVKKYSDKVKGEQGKRNLEAGQKFLAENKKKKGVVETASGLQYEVLTMGTGAKPLATDKVKTHYHGTLLNGKVFDSSVDRGQPISFPLNGVIKGWTEALQLMPVGSKWRLFIPANLAYGEQSPSATIGPNSTLIFEVELIDIEKQ